MAVHTLIRSFALFLLAPAVLADEIPFADPALVETGIISPYTVLSADIDGDGTLDLLTTGTLDNEVVWYANADGQGGFVRQPLITDAVAMPMCLAAADLDGDLDLDVVVGGFDTCAWFENTDGLGSFALGGMVQSGGFYRSVCCADIDGDGDVDIATGTRGTLTLGEGPPPEPDMVRWYSNVDGNGRFLLAQVVDGIAGGVTHLSAPDLDGDGDVDLVASLNASTVHVWYPNTDAAGLFGTAQAVNPASEVAPFWHAAADIDADGDLDVVTVSLAGILWYEHLDGAGAFGSARQVVHIGQLLGTTKIGTADVDGDGRLDVLSLSSSDKKLAWYRNEDGLGGFGVQQVLTTALQGLWDMDASDLDGDGDLDLAAVGSTGDQVAWFENLLENDAWSFLGHALAGSHGAPTLIGSGALAAGDTMSLSLSGALESAPVTVVVGLAALDAPFKGGVLVPSPDMLVLGLATDGAGALPLSTTWPSGVPAGFSILVQHWIVDAAGPVGFSASNAVVGTTP